MQRGKKVNTLTLSILTLYKTTVYRTSSVLSEWRQIPFLPQLIQQDPARFNKIQRAPTRFNETPRQWLEKGRKRCRNENATFHLYALLTQNVTGDIQLSPVKIAGMPVRKPIKGYSPIGPWRNPLPIIFPFLTTWKPMQCMDFKIIFFRTNRKPSRPLPSGKLRIQVSCNNKRRHRIVINGRLACRPNGRKRFCDVAPSSAEEHLTKKNIREA